MLYRGISRYGRGWVSLFLLQKIKVSSESLVNLVSQKVQVRFLEILLCLH